MAASDSIPSTREGSHLFPSPVPIQQYPSQLFLSPECTNNNTPQPTRSYPASRVATLSTALGASPRHQLTWLLHKTFAHSPRPRAPWPDLSFLHFISDLKTSNSASANSRDQSYLPAIGNLSLTTPRTCRLT